MGKRYQVEKKGPSGKKKLSRGQKVLITVLVVAAALVLAGVLVIHGYLSKLNYEDPNKYSQVDSIAPEEGDGTGSDTIDPNDIDAKLRANMEKMQSNLLSDANVTNILLIGTDTRVEGQNSRSDTMILLSINKNTKKIIMTSFLRDLYLAIPGKQNNRLNAANAFGGPKLLMETLQANFGVKVDKYVLVDFFGFMRIIDAVGGVDIDVSAEEAKVANNYIGELNSLTKQSGGAITQTGMQHLSGKQALGYSRIRYVGNGDFGRTSRQREVMTQVMDKIKKLSLKELNDFYLLCAPQVSTNMSEGDFFSLMLTVPTVKDYALDQYYIPLDGTFQYERVRGMSVVVPDIAANVKEFQKRVYNVG